jgi:mono/diheme cytochrome c family protein
LVSTGKRFVFLLWYLMAVLATLLIIGVVLASASGTDPALNGDAEARATPLTGQPEIYITPQPDSMFASGSRLAPPHMSDPPTQVEMGHYQYYMSCMICHGDQGQGLTEEWRSVLDPADMNCWQSKCHAPNHPPEGFEIPRNAPAVVGAGALRKYQTAADLYEYLRVAMPWSFPGLFDDEEYWRLTAYLAEANEVDFQKPLGPDNAANVLILSKLPQTHRTPIRLERATGVAVLVLLVGIAVLERWSQARS